MNNIVKIFAIVIGIVFFIVGLFILFQRDSVVREENSVVSVFFSNSKEDPDMTDCGKVYPVLRPVALSSYSVPEDVGADERLAQRVYFAISKLLTGPSEEETKEGFFTSIGQEVRINKVVIEGDEVKVDFSQELNTAGSCKVLAIRAQIEETLKQFSELNKITISVEGNVEEALQP